MKCTNKIAQRTTIPDYDINIHDKRKMPAIFKHVKILFLKICYFCVYVLNTLLCVSQAVNWPCIMLRKYVNHPELFCYVSVENLQAKTKNNYHLGCQKEV